MADRLPEDFRERAFRFICKLFDYCQDLARTPGPARQIANQLFDAGSSIGANLEESKASYSRRELASKNAISLKGSRESKYWLRVAAAKSLGKKDLREWLLQEADEFVAMLTVSVRRLQTERDPSSPKSQLSILNPHNSESL
jgi:four helix bundle protein